MAGKKRGMSMDDKKRAMLDLFHEKKDFFQLKELEKIAPKEKGIVQGTVKDVIQSLVDDGLVDTDKIGTSVYFWAFPSKAINTKQRKLEELEQQNEALKKTRADVEAKLEKAKAEMQDEGKRVEVMDQLKKSQDTNKILKEQLKQYAECDPDALQTLKKESKSTVTAANTWTDNIFAVKSWVKGKLSIEDKEINKNYNIPEDLDYLDE